MTLRIFFASLASLRFNLSMPKHIPALLLALLMCLSAAWGQERPLKTDDAKLLAPGAVRIDAGIEFLQNRTFTLSGLRGNLTSVGVLGVFAGAGSHAEFQVTGTLLNSLAIKERFPAPGSSALDFSGESTSSIGDFTLAAKFKLLEESGSKPALSFRFGVELPNGSNAKGLSNNQTNFYSSLLLGKSFGKFRTFGNVGLAILDNPTSARSQKDLFTYGWAATYACTDRLTLVSEINGRTGPGGPGTGDQSQVRLGVRWRAAGLSWDVAGVAGLAEEDPDSGIVLGVSYKFDIHGGSGKPRRKP